MKKLYIASGYNSYTNKEIRQAFNSEAEADKFLDGLTDPRIQVIAYKSTVELINHLLKGST
jgi:hypothetical protein